MKTFRKVLEDMSLAPTGKGREAAKKLYKKEDEIDELSIAQTQQRRRNKKLASLQKTMVRHPKLAFIRPKYINAELN